ncbi:MAG TPA: C69 family dipeptidase [Bacteroidales bacterium]|nr:C69 family dipeptidase [Bacteroidales bacterium]HNS46091.1 C69 family dipeptidase [Bacteroidales bacterium]
MTSSIRKSICLLFVLFQATVMAQQSDLHPFNCFTVIAGKNATTDGSVLFAHNEDDYGTRIVNWYKVEHHIHDSTERLTINRDGTSIRQAVETNAYLWLDMPELESSDTYMNEYGVVIASDQCDSREDNPELTEGGIGYWLRRIMAERAKSAREAVQIGGELIDRFGYIHSGRSYFIADPNEAWILAVVRGKHWVAQRIPDDKVAVVPNFYTISNVNLEDSSHYLGSSDLIGYALAKGWYDPKKDGEFSFRKAYSSPDKLVHKSNISRMWKGVNALAMNEYELDDDLPFSFLPERKVSLANLMDLLRDHYEGTSLDLTNGYQKGNPHFTENDPICSSTTQYGFVAQLRNYLPVDIGAVLWIAPYRPCVHPFVPWYCGLTSIPGPYQKYPLSEALDNHFNPPADLYAVADTLAYWYFFNHAKEIDGSYGELSPKAIKKSHSFERNCIRQQSALEREILFKHRKDTAVLKQKATEFTSEAAVNVLKLFK